ncbi:50S ribosomal protein L7/L12 [Clostridium sporogenes]|uniref:ribosomal protein L7/L12 n=1 Tax=Clostridium sporogenes TaxID=1509 RepID=UPI0006B27174|nr:ribosomal protein L7/L12 [Clostridium sporogenes]KOY66850.1 50S ribosomal protein L7/L12 [Clostridium sporogenes]KYN76108.1 50S ribosomal protein L7/L12 [Clostridium sporogenes]MBA4509465.1 ribosomal protein L7/L12 [Clostridium sporogenes]MDS1008362.1 ribosomal protein L7/L12 [Clostridium sporogenes]MDU6334555.1 ribosomal protein L7/L12 [Clostridium sporogenes]
MNYLTIFGIAVAGLLLWIVSSISQMRSDITRININLNKIAEQVGVPDTITDELKSLILEGKRVEAIKKYRIATGLGLKEAKEYIDSLSK